MNKNDGGVRPALAASFAIAKLQWRIIRIDPWFLIIMFAMPLAVMPFFRKTMALSLIDSGFEGATGAEQVVPGQTVLFGFFVAGSVGFSVFREHGWRTWDRLRTSPAGRVALLGGFGIAWGVVHIVYQLVLFLAGAVFFGLSISVQGFATAAVIMVAYAICLIPLMLLMSAAMRSVQQMSAFQNVGAMLLGGLGGALVPFDQLPGWAQFVAPITPAYWAMEGYNSILLDGGGLGDIGASIAVLIAMGALFTVLTFRRFRDDDVKEFFA